MNITVNSTILMKELLSGVWTDNRDMFGSISCILPRIGRSTENVWIKVGDIVNAQVYTYTHTQCIRMQVYLQVHIHDNTCILVSFPGSPCTHNHVYTCV